MTTFHVCTQHCDNWDPTTEKNSIENKQRDKQGPNLLTSIYCCSDALVFIKGKI